MRYSRAVRPALALRPTVAVLSVLLCAPPAAASRLDPALALQGWRVQPIEGRLAPLTFGADGATAIRIEAPGETGGAGIVFLPVQVPVHPALCLTWRWRVDGGAQGAGLVVRVGFEPEGERMSLVQRYALGFARALSPARHVPGFALAYRWGGEAGEPAWHPTPLLLVLERSRWLRPSPAASPGQWVEETVRLAQEFRSAYTMAPTAYVTELALGAVGGAGFSARIDSLAFRRC